MVHVMPEHGCASLMSGTKVIARSRCPAGRDLTPSRSDQLRRAFRRRAADKICRAAAPEDCNGGRCKSWRFQSGSQTLERLGSSPVRLDGWFRYVTGSLCYLSVCPVRPYCYHACSNLACRCEGVNIGASNINLVPSREAGCWRRTAGSRRVF